MTIPILLAAVGVLAAPAAAVDVAPRALVLRSADVPAGWAPAGKETGLRTNEDEAGTDTKSRALIARLGRVTGYQAEWRRGAMDSLVSRADVFRSTGGARMYLDIAADGLRSSGIKGLRRSPARIGDSGYVFHGGPNGTVAWVVWRSGAVTGTVVGWGLPRDNDARPRAKATASNRRSFGLSHAAVADSRVDFTRVMSWGSQPPLGLVVDSDPVRHASDVVEVADHLDRVRDLGVGQPFGAQGLDVGLVDLGGERRQLHREVAERTFARREVRLAIVVHRVVSRLVVCALGTEVVGMRRRSVATELLRRT